MGVISNECIPYGDGFSAKQMAIVFSGILSAWDNDLFNSYPERFHIDPDKRIKEYSKGMKLRLQLADALSHDARLLPSGPAPGYCISGSRMITANLLPSSVAVMVPPIRSVNSFAIASPRPLETWRWNRSAV